jgi:hypothetical protein
MIRERWDARAAAIDQQVRERLAAEGVRKLEDRNRDTLRIIDAAGTKYALRLRDRSTG